MGRPGRRRSTIAGTSDSPRVLALLFLVVATDYSQSTSVIITRWVGGYCSITGTTRPVQQQWDDRGLG